MFPQSANLAFAHFNNLRFHGAKKTTRGGTSQRFLAQLMIFSVMVDFLEKQLVARFESFTGCNCDITTRCSRNALRPGKVFLPVTCPSGLPRLARHSCIFESVYIIYPGMRLCQAERLSKWKVKPDDSCTLAFPALHSYRGLQIVQPRHYPLLGHPSNLRLASRITHSARTTKRTQTPTGICSYTNLA